MTATGSEGGDRESGQSIQGLVVATLKDTVANGFLGHVMCGEGGNPCY